MYAAGAYVFHLVGAKTSKDKKGTLVEETARGKFEGTLSRFGLCEQLIWEKKY